MKGDAEVIEFLNEALTAELTAINQYFIHAKMNSNWGYKRMAKRFYEDSIDEMKDEEDRRYSRIYDRIFETCYSMQFTGPSWRKKEANRRFTEMEKLFDID